jgi:hypothetical protein
VIARKAANVFTWGLFLLLCLVVWYGAGWMVLRLYKLGEL